MPSSIYLPLCKISISALTFHPFLFPALPYLAGFPPSSLSLFLLNPSIFPALISCVLLPAFLRPSSRPSSRAQARLKFKPGLSCRNARLLISLRAETIATFGVRRGDKYRQKLRKRTNILFPQLFSLSKLKVRNKSSTHSSAPV